MAPMIFLPLVQQQQKGGALVADDTFASQYATYLVRADWQWAVSDGTAPTFVGANNDLVAEANHGVKSVRIRRGRDDALSSMRAGEATIVLHDPDGLYNPLNTASTLYGELTPMTPIEVQYYVTTVTGATQGHLFSGYIRSIEHNPRLGEQETILECVDQLALIDRLHPSGAFAGGPETKVADLIAATLGDFTYAVFSADYEYGGGQTIPSTSGLDGTRSALEVIEQALAMDRGVVYVEAAGGLRYESRATRTARTSTVTVADTMETLRPGVDLDRVANRARVTRTGGETQEANDTTSQDLYGVIDVGDIESEFLNSDADALTLAQYLVNQFKDPRSPMFAMEQMNRDAAALQRMLTTELQERVTVTDSLGGTSGDYHVESIEHEITEGGKWHRCNWLLSARGAGTQTGHAGVVGAASIAPAPTVTYVESTSIAFPASPRDRDEVYVVVDSAEGIVWHFRYRAASSDASKWEFVGGPPLTARIDTDQSTASGTFTNLTTTGPTVTAPFAGDYLVSGRSNSYNSGVATNLMSYAVGATAASTTNAGQGAIAAANYSLMLPFSNRHDGVSASTAFTAKYATTAGTANFRYRWMSLLPVRVSG